MPIRLFVCYAIMLAWLRHAGSHCLRPCLMAPRFAIQPASATTQMTFFTITITCIREYRRICSIPPRKTEKRMNTDAHHARHFPHTIVSPHRIRPLCLSSSNPLRRNAHCFAAGYARRRKPRRRQTICHAAAHATYAKHCRNARHAAAASSSSYRPPKTSSSSITCATECSIEQCSPEHHAHARHCHADGRRHLAPSRHVTPKVPRRRRPRQGHMMKYLTRRRHAAVAPAAIFDAEQSRDTPPSRRQPPR